jgi:ribonuclease P protein component
MRSPRSLSARRQFLDVFAEGRRARSDGLTVWALPRFGMTGMRLGLAVRTGSGGAASRNRIRRRLRALVRTLPPQGADIVIRADSSAMALSFQELASHLRIALQRTGIVEHD